MNKTSKLSCLTIIGIMGAILSAQAATITVNSSAPSVDNEDIYSFAATGGTAITGESLADYVSPSDGAPDVNSLWRDRGAQGQSFTTGSNALGYTLDAFSFMVRIGGSSVGVAPVTTFRLGTLSGTGRVFTEITSATATPGAINNTGDWLTASFDSSIELTANTVYAIDFQNTEVTSWDGYYLDGDVDSSYAGGSAYTSGLKTEGLDDANLSLPTIDRTFHVNLVAVPEPETYALIGGCLALGYVTVRRRR
jgi:hypothetical protein